MDIGQWVQRFPFALGTTTTCPDCQHDHGETVLLEDTYVHDPDTQEHWRGTPALKCPQCGYTQRNESPPA